MVHTIESAIDAETFEREVMPHSEFLKNYAQKVTRGDGTEADEIYQETLIRAWQKYFQFRGKSNLKSWLYTIMKNIFLQRLREQRKSRVELIGLDFRVLDNLHPTNQNAGEEAHRMVYLQEVRGPFRVGNKNATRPSQ